jgi:DNA-3-methyladenine glycosylase I
MNKHRCFGNKPNQGILAQYHDTEWCIEKHDDRMLFELLILEGAHAGLSWEIVLKKRQGYKDAFYDFDVQKIINMSDDDLDKLKENPKIIRNRLKIYSVRKNAKVFMAIQEEFGSFDKYIWSFTDFKQIINSPKTIEDMATTSEISDKISKDLKRRGMSFVGSTIIYSYMQAIGIVVDHIQECFLYKK